MMNLTEYRRTATRLADFLPWVKGNEKYQGVEMRKIRDTMA